MHFWWTGRSFVNPCDGFQRGSCLSPTNLQDNRRYIVPLDLWSSQKKFFHNPKPSPSEIIETHPWLSIHHGRSTAQSDFLEGYGFCKERSHIDDEILLHFLLNVCHRISFGLSSGGSFLVWSLFRSRIICPQAICSEYITSSLDLKERIFEGKLKRGSLFKDG